MENKIVSFDFDYTLSRESIQKFAKELIDKGIEAIIITSRYEHPEYHGMFIENANADLYAVAQSVGIKRIYFTNFKHKIDTIANLNLNGEDVIFHLDDDWFELDLINKHSGTRGISSWMTPNWKNKCIKTLRKVGLYD